MSAYDDFEDYYFSRILPNFVGKCLGEYDLANKAVEFTIRGKLDWCKLLGPARPYSGDPRFDKGPSWSVEINPDEKSRALLKKHNLESKLKRDKKEKKDGTARANVRPYDYLRLTILENRADGEKNKRPEIIDASGRKWDQETEMGNGTVADILVRYVDYGTTQGLYFKKMRVLKLVEYEGGSDFEPLSEDDEFFAASGGFDGVASNDDVASPAFDSDMDDDVPF
jgi:hypothetical protein